MALITTTPAGIDPYESDNWGRLAASLIKDGNGIGLDNDGALLNLGSSGTSSGSGTVYLADETWLHLNTVSSTFSHIGPSTITQSSQSFTSVTVGGNATDATLIFGTLNLKFDGKGHFGGTATGLTPTLTLHSDPWVSLGPTSGSLTLTHNTPGTVSGTYSITSLVANSFSATASAPTLVCRFAQWDFDDRGHSLGHLSGATTITLQGVIAQPGGTANSYTLQSFNGSQSWVAKVTPVIPAPPSVVDGKKYVPYIQNGTWGWFEVGAC